MKTRIISILIMLPIVIGIIQLGGGWYRSFVSILLAIGSFEFIYSQNQEVGIINKLLVIIALLFLINIDIEPLFFFTTFAFISIVIITLNFLLFEKSPKLFYEKSKLMFFTLIYIGVLGSHLNIIFFKDWDMLHCSGKVLLYYILIFTWVSDSGAYLAGRKYGKRKMAPIISPKKTIEGLIGGIISGFIFNLIFTYFFMKSGNRFFITIPLSILLSVVCVWGDLCASVIKRAVDIKDYSHIIPGHGGIVDRLDSILYNIVFVVFYLNLVDKFFS